MFAACVSLVVLLEAPSCTPHGVGNYRLEKFGDVMVLIPPPYWHQSESKSVIVRLPLSRGIAVRPNENCSLASEPFKISPHKDSSAWVGTLPSLDDWERRVSRGNFHTEFEDFLDQIDDRGDHGCFDPPVGALLARAVKESVPTLIHEADYYRYGYQLGTGSVDLEPGMRLKIVRAEFDSSEKFERTATVSYRVVRDSGEALGFELETGGSEALAEVNGEGQMLTARDKGMFYNRLFFSGKDVPPDLSYAAVIVGTHSFKRMNEISRQLRTHPETACPDTKTEAVCVPFQGAVTVSVELPVEINGQKEFVGTGQTLRGLLNNEGLAACEVHRNSLRIKRAFLNALVPVDFDAATDSILDLTLLSNDRITCPSGSSNGKSQMGATAKGLRDGR